MEGDESPDSLVLFLALGMGLRKDRRKSKDPCTVPGFDCLVVRVGDGE